MSVPNLLKIIPFLSWPWVELPPAGLVSHWLNLAAEFFSLTQGLFPSSSQAYTYLLLPALRHTCRLCQEISTLIAGLAVSIYLRTENAQHWLGRILGVWLEQATKFTNICIVESLQQAFLGCLLFPDRIILYRTSTGFLWAWDSPLRATWNCLWVNSEPDRIKLHRTVQAFRSKRFFWLQL